MIVDAEKGLAVISRSVVPFDLGVLSLTFAESIIIPGKVIPHVLIRLIIGGVSPSYIGYRVYILGSKTSWGYSSSINSTCN